MITDTICAISTAYGTAGISVIRVSGDEAIEKVNQIFKGKNLLKVDSHTIHYGHIMGSDNKEIDEVMVAVLRNPRSFTTEDMVEISTHGGILVTQKVLKRLLSIGVRMANPGEFTERAFVSGRIDLAESEAVMDLINAKNDNAMKLALNALKGETSKLINDLRDKLLGIIAIIEVNIDYPEYDDTVEMTNQLVKPEIEDFIKALDEILKGSNKGRLLKEGVSTAIIGKPNVGKSSLLNALLNEERAIVTSIAGTTRDTVEASINIGGITLNLIDTAGIRETSDLVEKIGIDRSKKAINQAELVILVLDLSASLSKEDEILLELTKHKRRILVGNKKDLGYKLELKDIIPLSALTKDNLDALESKIINILQLEDIGADFNYISSVRHIQKLEETKILLQQVLGAIEAGLPIDMVEIDIRNAWQTLGEITGDYHPEDLIDELFSKFCLGK
ncbi:MAG: tRNA uridine-5-carboxymethylaminomethyl(34) synthesis GTPase MnmE [Acholeplasmataceae bacterium]|nr:tRNA uridine-5-carboxymethylaminomethyl(34) synthesis GTPase MnmE [Acholeplasmataceae bacterium]MDD4469191.1 tRNA uridine-5-carboxymethylaminomethyl(34) synthesis GTPase MnmE [Acholeplasmataceae bacterium]MDD4823926.1 tRNA uridine-5-carboxymethylaminomethyl(34) synthesis GTPase MnmE [Acholeplasmataceae bacterium]